MASSEDIHTGIDAIATAISGLPHYDFSTLNTTLASIATAINSLPKTQLDLTALIAELQNGRTQIYSVAVQVTNLTNQLAAMTTGLNAFKTSQDETPVNLRYLGDVRDKLEYLTNKADDFINNLESDEGFGAALIHVLGTLVKQTQKGGYAFAVMARSLIEIKEWIRFGYNIAKSKVTEKAGIQGDVTLGSDGKPL
jgi:chaperonin cofactor prefoldin